MENIFITLSPKKCLLWVYLGTLLLSFHTFLSSYINSSFLLQFLEEPWVGSVFAFGSALSIAGVILVPREIKVFGKFRTLLAFAFIELVATLTLAYTDLPSLALISFLLKQVTITVIFFILDIYLEDNTPVEGMTGIVRGFFMTAANVALVASPLLSGFLAERSFREVYLVSAVFIFVFILLAMRKLPARQKTDLAIPSTRKALLTFLWDGNLRHVILANLLLQTFYAVMIIYTPLYLFKEVGLSWETMGVLFSVMLLPFLIFELPIGALADQLIGEKEMMFAGFATLALFTAIFPLVPGASLALLGATLFLTRVGAALVEMTTESYFFKKVNGRNSDLIGVYRLSNPVAFTLGPIAGSLVLAVSSYQVLFWLLGGLLVFGMYLSARLEDTL